MKNALTGSGTIESSEREAITRAQRGDGVGFEYLYKKYSRRVYSVCLRMTRNSAEAEDLTQQTFLQVSRKIGTFRGESGFSTWLHRVTVNVVLMHLRRRKPAEIVFEDLDRAQLWAVPNSARVARDDLMTTAQARISVAAQRCASMARFSTPTPLSVRLTTFTHHPFAAPIGIHLRNSKNNKIPPICTFLLIYKLPKLRARGFDSHRPLHYKR